MSNSYEIDESKFTEYNSNQFVIFRLHEINYRVQQCFTYHLIEECYQALRSYYTEINPKLIEFKKVDEKATIDKNLNKYRQMRNSGIPESFKWDVLQELYDQLHIAANNVGMGMTTKQSQSSIADDI